jgi:hypothetical protein
MLGDAVLTSSFIGRLLGIHRSPQSAVLLHAGSVHGKGLAEPVLVAHLTSSGRVTGHEVLEPGGAVGAGSFWVLELPTGRLLPPIGATIAVLPSSPR